ncbi:MAG: PD-(D/E)XK nuclease family protein [Georgfuchsia sp.]
MPIENSIATVISTHLLRGISPSLPPRLHWFCTNGYGAQCAALYGQFAGVSRYGTKSWGVVMALDVLVIPFVGILILVILWWLWLLYIVRVAAVLPPELRTAPLIYAERLFRSVGPVSITAKVDRVYRNAMGELVLLELKTRPASRVYPSDVIELSAQRVAVMAHTQMSVAEYAYVLTEMPDRRTAWHRVELARAEAVMALVLRRNALLAGDVDARCARSVGICRTCGFRRECHSTQWHPVLKGF